jgi:hypothetical protein
MNLRHHAYLAQVSRTRPMTINYPFAMISDISECLFQLITHAEVARGRWFQVRDLSLIRRQRASVNNFYCLLNNEKTVLF